MKNQNDLIFSIVFAVLGLIAVGVAYGTKPEVPPAPSVAAINTADAPLPTGTDPTMGLALGTGSTAGGTGGGFGGGRGGSYPGGRGGFPGGPPSGFGGPSMGRPPMGGPGMGGPRGAGSSGSPVGIGGSAK